MRDTKTGAERIRHSAGQGEDVRRASLVKTCEKKAARFPKSFAAFLLSSMSDFD